MVTTVICNVVCYSDGSRLLLQGEGAIWPDMQITIICYAKGGRIYVIQSFTWAWRQSTSSAMLSATVTTRLLLQAEDAIQPGVQVTIICYPASEMIYKIQSFTRTWWQLPAATSSAMPSATASKKFHSPGHVMKHCLCLVCKVICCAETP